VEVGFLITVNTEFVMIKNIKSNKHEKDYSLRFTEVETGWEGTLVYYDSMERTNAILTETFKGNDVDNIIKDVKDFLSLRGYHITVYSTRTTYVGRRIDFEINGGKKIKPDKLLSGHFVYIRPDYYGFDYEKPDELDNVILSSIRSGLTSSHSLNMHFNDFKKATSRKDIESWKPLILRDSKQSLGMHSPTIPEELSQMDVMLLPNSHSIKETITPIYFLITYSANDSLPVLIPSRCTLDTQSESLINLFHDFKRIDYK
jgi:hypothetical protein